MLVSSFVGKKIVGLYEGEMLATVLRPIFNKQLKKIKGFLAFDIDDNEVFLSCSDIYSFDECVTIKNSLKLTKAVEDDESLIGKNIFSTKGEEFGALLDIDFNDKYEITNLITDREKLTSYKLFSCGKDIIISTSDNLTQNLVKPKIKSMNLKNNDITIKLQEKTLEKKPLKFNGNTKLLLGRTIKTDIIGKNYELLAKKGQIINEKMIESAKIHNKINYLFFNSII